MRNIDLENRLIEFSTSIIELCKFIQKSEAGQILKSQILRSGTSITLNYAEAQSAESNKDFLHKMRLSLKELRETHVSLKIIFRAKLFLQLTILEAFIKESNELIAIFVSSIRTASNRKVN